MIEQTILATTAQGGIELVTQSSGFREEWVAAAKEICAAFGGGPNAVACPGCVFALPLVRGQVVVGQVAGRGKDGTGPLAFRLLAVPKSLYADLHGDPFRIADAYPPTWDETGPLPSLEWTGGPPPHRTIADVQRVLDVPYSATLLGGVQALIDGGRLVFERTAPDDRMVRALWTLLPVANRCEMWPATYAFGNDLGFNVLVVPRAEGPTFANYVTEVQAGDYPEGRYELALQIAAEGNHQDGLDKLFNRRSRRQTMRLAMILLALFMALPLMNLFFDPPPRPPTTASKPMDSKPEPAKEHQR